MALRTKLVRRLRKTDTEERCGLILTGDKVIEVKNIAEEPERGFEIDAEEMIKHEADLIGTWHTHPGEGSNLSERDYLGFLMWPKLTHYIIGVGSVSSYNVQDGVVLNAD